jgi:hypothetical protein
MKLDDATIYELTHERRTKGRVHECFLMGGEILSGECWRDPDDSKGYFFRTEELAKIDRVNWSHGVYMFEGMEYLGTPRKILSYVEVVEHNSDGWFYLLEVPQPR